LVLANVTALTVRVSHTFRFAARNSVRVWDQTWFASADGIAGSCNRTNCSWAAWGRVAGIRLDHTTLVLADVSSLAVGVPHTLWLATGDCVRIGDETSLTSADGIARAGDGTNCSGTTGRWEAGIWLLDTSLVPADQSPLAVWVPHTLRATAGDGVRLGNETWLAGADGIALWVWVAESSRATGVWKAGVLRWGRPTQREMARTTC